MTLVFAVMHLYNILEFFIASVHSFFVILFKNLLLINRRNGPRYQRVLALCAFFFNRGDTEGTNSSKKCLCDICVCFVLCNFVSGLVLWFLDKICGLMTCVQSK